MSELVSLAAGATLAVVLISFVLAKRGSAFRNSEVWTWKLVLSGIGVIGLPSLLLLLGRQQLNSVMAVATQAGVPIVVAVTSGATESGSELQTRLMPGLIAVCGTLMILPVGLPQSLRGWIGFSFYLAAACLGGICTVICHRELRSVGGGAGWTVVVGANAVFFWATASVWLTVTTQWHLVPALPFAETLVSALWIAASTIGGVALLQLLRPMATASRFVFVPLFATLEAYVLLRPTLSSRTIIGCLLMLLGGVACVHSEDESIVA